MKELKEVAEGKIKSVKYIGYDTRDGIITTTCIIGVQPAICKSRDGRIWFTTVKGVLVTDPSNLLTNAIIPPVHIEKVLVDKRLADVNQPQAFPPGHGDVEIHYTGLSFIAPEKARFKYKLEGFDREWVDADTRRVAYYTNLSPGSYRFRVMACNSDGQWNETGAAFSFTLIAR